MTYLVGDKITHFNFDLLYGWEILINGKRYLSVEQYYAIKRLGSKKATSDILEIRSPFDVRRYYRGKPAKSGFKGYRTLKNGYRALFKMHRDHRKTLLKTGDLSIKRYVDPQPFWNPGAGDFGNKEIMGKLFMKLREEFRMNKE